MNIVKSLTLTLFVMAALPFLGNRVSADVTSFELGDGGDEELVRVYSVISLSSVESGRLMRAAVVADIVPGWHINSATPYEDYLIPAEVVFDTIEFITPGKLAYPTAVDARLGEELMSVYDGRAVIDFVLEIDENAPAGEYILPVSFSYQPCNNRECRAPQDVKVDLKVTVGESGHPINDNIFAAVIPDDGSVVSQPIAEPPPEESSELQQLIAEYGFWGYFLLLGSAFVTGLLLSFSPCTYPMIPITVSIFAGQERSVGRGFFLSLVYVGTMAVVYGVMGLVVSLVVSPCVGPFVAGILLYIATNGSPTIGFLTLFVFAMGLGTLFIVIGTFSSAIGKLPRSGEWMEQVKKFFGFVLLLMAVYFLRTLVSADIIAVVTSLILITFGVFGGGFDRLTSDSGFFPRLKRLLGVLALIVGGYLLLGSLLNQGFILPAGQAWLPSGGAATVTEESGIRNWETDLEAGLARARAENRPVIIDTWATWCANCRVLENKTFHHSEVGRAAERFLPIKVQLESENSPETKAFKERFGLKTYTLPTTVLLNGDGSVHRIIPGVIGPEDFIAELKKIR